MVQVNEIDVMRLFDALSSAKEKANKTGDPQTVRINDYTVKTWTDESDDKNK